MDFSPLHASSSSAAVAPAPNRRVVNTAPGSSEQRLGEAESSDEATDEERVTRDGDLERRSGFTSHSSGSSRKSSRAAAAAAAAASVSGTIDEGEWPPWNNDIGVTGLTSLQQRAGAEESKRGSD